MNDALIRSFARDLRARNKSPRTIQSYTEACRTLAAHLDADLAEATRDDLRGFFADQVARHRPATAAIRFRSLQQFYKWAHAEGITDPNPMAGLKPPSVPEHPVPVLSIDDVTRLLKACSGKDFTDRRDQAMLRLFLEPGGLRLSEMVGLSVSDVDFGQDVAVVLGKGRRPRAVPFGNKTGQALERYVRARAQHPGASRSELGLGQKGPLTGSGVAQMMRRRAAQVGLAELHPHMLRHTAAHEWLSGGGQETDAMRLFGWRSRAMLGRYGASAADERAQAASRRMGLGDRY